jgi:hypothetical protein
MGKEKKQAAIYIVVEILFICHVIINGTANFYLKTIDNSY